MGEENERPEESEYLNPASPGYKGPRCQYVYRSEELVGKRCGLPAWEDASGAQQGDPRCEFHSRTKPADIKQRLEAAVRAGAKLAEAYLEGTDLREAQLEEAKLSAANLSRADLRSANLSGAVLSDANLSGAYLRLANLSGALLRGANLSRVDLWRANLSGAVLQKTNLSGAHLRDARLGGLWQMAASGHEGEKMSGGVKHPDLRNADLRGAVFSGIEIAPETKLDGAKFGPEARGPISYTLRDESLARDETAWQQWRNER